MNGRIYDPTLGRFLQADPFIQAPKNSQSYNRYSYVLNNPMSYTDPSGYFFSGLKKAVKKYWRVAVAAIATYVTAGAASGWAAGWLAGKALAGSQIAIGAIAGAIAGAAGGVVATGSLKGALKGAISGAVFGGLGGSFKAYGVGDMAQVGAHALAGGVMSDLQGGNFGHGFFTAGIMKGIGKINTSESIGRVMVQAIAGGTVSKLTGGKFANGAVTAAIQFTVNEIGGSKSFKRWGNMWRSAGKKIANFFGSVEDSAENGAIAVTEKISSTASIVAKNPIKATAAGLAVIGGAKLCMTGAFCPGGVALTAWGVDQTHALANGNNITTTEAFVGDFLSTPDARAAFPFVENPGNAARILVNSASFAVGGAGIPTVNLVRGTGTGLDIADTLVTADTLNNLGGGN
ncbi:MULTISPECIES: RHS repeat-associated core domain-containing protein [unclassified Pseudoalteromonas]|uniref:RHS repeat-associated core domain-containing protein n=1 Tax=unclassified Pseudoalteromonas TaxID=194690 RepID=UPI0005A9E5D8|nr:MULTISPECIES: RHS repeat-associated core domain-containing protein [unclassified Pseudoalteromonas]